MRRVLGQSCARERKGRGEKVTIGIEFVVIHKIAKWMDKDVTRAV